jgi:hypothetical protein
MVPLSDNELSSREDIITEATNVSEYNLFHERQGVKIQGFHGCEHEFNTDI